MKRLFLILALAIMFGLGSNYANAGTSVSLSFSFNDALSPYGSWIHSRSYGNSWRPRVDHGWRPYSQGHWIYSSYGPMWDSPEPYGWAVYHYGKWVYDDYYGWIWVPGYDWYPSRVSWAYGDDYLGWSPIYDAPSTNVNFWLFIDRGHFGYNNYSNVYLRHDRVRPLFEHRRVHVRKTNFRRDELERIVRRPVRVTPVGERFVQADNKRVRMVVPKHREATVLREVSRSHERARAKGRPAVGKSTVVKKSEVKVNRNNDRFDHRSSSQKTFRSNNPVLKNRNDQKPKIETRSRTNSRPQIKYQSKQKPQIKNDQKRTYTKPDSRSIKQNKSSAPKYKISRFNSDRREPAKMKAPSSRQSQVKSFRSNDRPKTSNMKSRPSERSKVSQIKSRTTKHQSRPSVKKSHGNKSSAKRSKSKPHSH